MPTRFPSIMSTSALPKKILQHECNLTHSSLPSIMKEGTRTSPLPMQHEGNLTFASFHFIFVKESTSALPRTMTFHHEGKISCVRAPYTTRTSALLKKQLHHEGNLTHASLSSITRTNALP